MTQVNKAITSKKFRDTFRYVHKELLRWFPGHMGKGLKQMQQKLKSVDCIIEVHDARIPFSGRNKDFKYTIGNIKPHILVLNKSDLIDKKMKIKIEKNLQYENIQHVVYTNCKNQKCSGIRKLLPLVKDLVKNSNRYSRNDEIEFCVMAIGVPNVGKSSLVNVLRNINLYKTGASHVGAVPGITRNVSTRIKICNDPSVYLLDTPGILTPDIRDTDAGLKLALCSCLHDHLVGEEIIADYLLYWLNKQNIFTYVDIVGLNAPSDDIGEVLSSIAIKLKKTKIIRNYEGRHVRIPDLTAAALFMLQTFRKGELGKICLDSDMFQK